MGFRFGASSRMGSCEITIEMLATITVRLRAAPILSPQKVPIGISATWRDITARKKSEEHEMLLKRELSHRVKNSLTVIQSIAQLTLRSTSEPEVFARAFQGRLQALARAHDILTTANWLGVEFGALAHQSCTSSRPMPVSMEPCPWQKSELAHHLARARRAARQASYSPRLWQPAH